MHPNHRHQIFEGLRPNDLVDMVSHRFTIDQYKSKMGDDETIVVLAFKVKDKFPAIDMMEFIEKGYTFVLDADMSTGEESDGQYSVFVEIERDRKIPEEIEELLNDLSKLCKISNWRFRYFRDIDSHDFSKESIEEVVPLDVESYKLRVKNQTTKDVNEVLNIGTTEVLDIDGNNLTIKKPLTGNITMKLESIGRYDQLSKELKGAIQLDESSNSQVLFLEKYLGNCEIHKINNKFLIRNQDNAIIVSSNGDW